MAHGWGYIMQETGPTMICFWDSPDAKEQGKGKLWDITMLTSDPKGESAVCDTSIHTMVNGGMFAQDSDRSYHASMVAVPKRA